MKTNDERPVVQKPSDPEKFNWQRGDVQEVAPDVTVGGACPACHADPCTCDPTAPVDLLTDEERFSTATPQAEPELPAIGGACGTCLNDPCTCSTWGP